MRRAQALLLLAALGGCKPAEPSAEAGNAASTPASSLERAAIDTGIVADVSKTSPVGLFRVKHEAGRDRLCILPDEKGYFRFGMQVSIGEESACTGHGTARRAGEKLIFNFARSSCLIVASYEGDRVVLPGALDVSCSDLCSGRGTLEGVAFPRITRDEASARAERTEEGETLCVAG